MENQGEIMRPENLLKLISLEVITSDVMHSNNNAIKNSLVHELELNVAFE